MNITKQNVDYTKIYEIRADDPDLGQPGNEVKLHLNRLNRAINTGHANEIRAAINAESWRQFSPIEVNINTGNILDGQHRWQAFVTLDDELKPQVYVQIRFYDIPEENEITVIRDKNTNNKNWTVKAFTESNRAAGNCKEINYLYKFCETHDKCHKTKKDGSIGSLNLRYGAAFLWGCNPSKNLKTGDFRGNLSLSQNMVNAADRRYKEVDRMVSMLGYTKTGTWYEAFTQAWYDIYKNEECSDQLKNIGLDAVCENIKNNKIIQQYTNKADWFDYFKSVGLGLS